MATYGTGTYGTGTYGTLDGPATYAPAAIGSTAVVGELYAEVFLWGTRGHPDPIAATTTVGAPSSDLLAGVHPDRVGPLVVMHVPGASGPGVYRPNVDEFELLQPMMIPRGVVPIPRVPLPPAPVSLNAIPSADGTFVVVDWARVQADAVVYELELDLGTRVLVNGTTFTHYGLAPGSTHSYRVAALTAGGRGPFTDLRQIVTSGVTLFPARIVGAAVVGRPAAQQQGMLYATPDTIVSLTVVHIPGASPVKTVTRPAVIASTLRIGRPAVGVAPLLAAPAMIASTTALGLPRATRSGNTDATVSPAIAVRVTVGAPTATVGRAPTTDGATYDLATYANTWTGEAMYDITVTDPIGLADPRESSMSYARAQTDLAELADVAATAVAHARTQTDPAGLTDHSASAATYGRAQTDPLGATDAIAP